MAVPQRLPLWEKNRAANGDFEPYIELYPPAQGAPRPAVLVIPGGGYHMLAEWEARPIAEKFIGLGFQAAVLYYRVAPRRYPDPLLDALRAVQLLRFVGERGGVDSRRVAAMGFSAGGHLAALAGTLAGEVEVVANDPADEMNARPDALVLGYPVISSQQYMEPHSFANLAGDDRGLIDFLSAEKRVDERTPPAFLWHTAEDEVVPVENSLLFAASMSRFHRRTELHVFPEGRHGLNLAVGYSAGVWPELAAAFLRRVLE